MKRLKETFKNLSFIILKIEKTQIFTSVDKSTVSVVIRIFGIPVFTYLNQWI